MRKQVVEQAKHNSQTDRASMNSVSAIRPAIRDRSPSLPVRVANKGLRFLLEPSLQKAFHPLILVMEALAIIVGFVLAVYLVHGESWVGHEARYFAPALLTLWLAISITLGLYDRRQKRWNHEALLRATVWGTSLLTVGLTLYLQSGFSLPEIVLAGLFIGLLQLGLRFFHERGTRFLYRSRLGLIPILVVGEKEERAWVCQTIKEVPSVYTLAGELRMNDANLDLRLLRQVLDRTKAKAVILAGTKRFPDVQLSDFLRSMRLRRVKVWVTPNVATMAGCEPVIFRNVSIPLLEVSYPRLDRVQRSLKTTLDVTCSLGALALFLPLLVVIAISIKLTSRGPVFFRQQRIGADEQVFTCYKFRSMYQDAEQRQAELEDLNEASGIIFMMRKDPRVTSVGRVLRRWSIDELPQLINVLKGEMSLVGPRPLPIRDFDRMDESHKKRFAAIPGISGYWQIKGRRNHSFEEMVRLDLHYIDNWSLFLDISIIFRTLGIVLHREGSY